MNYITIAVACVIALVLGIVMLYENEMMSIEIKRKFTFLALIIICEIVIDTVLLVADGRDVISEKTFKFWRIVEYSVSQVIVAFFANIITHESIWNKIRKCFVILIVTNLIGQIITFLGYISCSSFYVYSIILIGCIVLLVFSTSKSIVQSNAKISYTIVFLASFWIIGIFVKEIFHESNFDWLCVSFCYLIFIIYFCNNYLKVDSLTSLLNRRAFDNKMETINFSTAIIVIDANDFKKINDSYGHQSGDLALSKISEIIFKVYNKIGFCYRIGGDEFCVILRQGMLKKLTYETKNCDTYLMLENLIKMLNEEIKK